MIRVQLGAVNENRAYRSEVVNPRIGIDALTFGHVTGLGEPVEASAIVNDGSSAGSNVADALDGLDARTAAIEDNNRARTPVGGILDYAGATAPNGWLLTYGQCVSRTVYAALFAVLSTTYGTCDAGDGADTGFRIPDTRGRVVAGQDDMGGASANRLTAQSGGVDGDTLGGAGGAETHTLTIAQMPSHSHDLTTQFQVEQAGHAAGNRPSGNSNENTGVDTSTAIKSVGGGGAHNNVQPTFILNKIIYAGL